MPETSIALNFKIFFTQKRNITIFPSVKIVFKDPIFFSKYRSFPLTKFHHELLCNYFYQIEEDKKYKVYSKPTELIFFARIYVIK